MHNSIIYFIFPKDETTDFLDEIFNHVSTKTEANITLHRIETISDHTSFLDKANDILPENGTIIFMGHGMSTALSGASIGTSSYGPFISESELSIFKNRKVVLLTCRSTEYLKQFGKDCGLKAGLGFPNLITDPYEILYPEEPERVNGIKNTDIDLFKKLLVDIVKYSLEEYIIEKLSFYEFYKRIKLRVQKALIQYYSLNPCKGKTPYGKMLYDLNDGISIIGN